MNNALTEEEKEVIINKRTEAPFTGEYDDFYEEGIYICKQCSTPLFTSKAKFDAGCGWPSFDDAIDHALKVIPDADGVREEIICANCGAHLGHVFKGEKLTTKDTRHCVNSLSIKFIPQHNKGSNDTIYFAGGCFWCTEAVFKRIEGVLEVIPGYSGGSVDNPSYEKVSKGSTGHVETVKVVFDNTKTQLKTLLEVFFKTHDPTSLDQQGNDKGPQYKSAIFYTTLDQKEEIEKYTTELEKTNAFSNKKIVTEVTPFVKFYKAEEYHLNYYANNPYNAYCTFVIEPKLKKLEQILAENK